MFHLILLPVVVVALSPPTIGVDYGLRRIGVSVGVGLASRELPIIPHTGNETLAALEIIRLALGEQARTFVVGLPLNRHLEENDQSMATRDFAKVLATVARRCFGNHSQVFLWDERYTTQAAEALVTHQAARPAHVDSVAACLILDDFFHNHGPQKAETVHPDPLTDSPPPEKTTTTTTKRVPTSPKPSPLLLKYMDELR